MKNVCILTLILLSGCTVIPTSSQMIQEPVCKLTCNNSNYVKPVITNAPKRHLPAVGESLASKLQDSYGFISPISTDIKPNPNQALLILESIDLSKLKPSEIPHVHHLKAYIFIQLDRYDDGIREANLFLSASPQISLFNEVSMLKILMTLYVTKNESQNALNTLEKWALLTTDITHNDYIQISKIYEMNGDLTRSIANQARAIELVDIGFTTPIDDYRRLQSLYLNNNQLSEAENIQKFINVTVSESKKN